jgi:serine/threonine protein kinase
MPGIAIGKYDVLSTLGQGAHSTIYRVRRQADYKEYALKVVAIHGADQAKFRNQAIHEFRVAQQLDHGNLIKIHALETTRDWLFRVRKIEMLIEYVNGKTLDQHRDLSLGRLVEVFRRVAAGLGHMHRRGVCHADMKPNNILLSHTGEVKVIDYGLAWLRGEDKGRIQGTPEYLAPETARIGVVSERTDIFNFGATMYRLVTSRHPPRAITEDGHFKIDAKTWQKLMKPVEELNPQAPPELCDLIHRCLSYAQQDRPGMMSEIEEILDRLAVQMAQSSEDCLDAPA